MTTPDEFLAKAAENAPFLVLLAITIWLSLPQLAERFEIISKLLRPLSRRWREKAERLERQRREAEERRAQEIAAAALKKMTPPDVRKMEERLLRIEDVEEMLRAFVIYDELWHFHDDHNEARRGRAPAHRMTFDRFEKRWNTGWRPFDEGGSYVGDPGPEGDLPQDDRALNQYRNPGEQV